jgi:hypothetical protein
MEADDAIASLTNLLENGFDSCAAGDVARSTARTA